MAPQQQHYNHLRRVVASQHKHLRDLDRQRAEAVAALTQLSEQYRDMRRQWEEAMVECEKLQARLQRTIDDRLVANSAEGALDPLSTFPTVQHMAHCYAALMGDQRQALIEDIEKFNSPRYHVLVGSFFLFFQELMDVFLVWQGVSICSLENAWQWWRSNLAATVKS